MHTRTLILLLGLVACALAARGGGGGGGRGGRGWGRSGPGGFGHGGRFGGAGRADIAPKSCKDDAEKSKQCFTDNLKSKGVTVNIEDVKSCFESCQRPARPEGGDAARGNRTKGGWGGERHGKGGERNGTNNWGGRHGKGGERNGTGAHGNFTQMREQMKTFRECMDGKLGDNKQEQCVKGKITYAVATRDEKPRAKGGRGGFGGFGNPLKSLKNKIAQCGAETENCVKSAMGEWYDKTDELSQILCDASKACPHTPSDACKADRKAGRDARCACKEQLKKETEDAKAACTTDENRDFLDRVSKRGGAKGKGEHNPCDDDSDEDDSEEHERERKSPFCS